SRMTFAPYAANVRAAQRPMPSPAPVTMITRPANRSREGRYRQPRSAASSSANIGFRYGQGVGYRHGLRRVKQVVHVDVAAERRLARERVVRHADDFMHGEARVAYGVSEFRRPDELAIVVRSARHQIQEILCADHREGPRFRIAVDRREEDLTARLR